MPLMEDVVGFHEKFNLNYEGPPRMLDEAAAEFRVDFMIEEVIEYQEAVAAGDMAKALDALIDLTYISLGTAVMHGFHNEDRFQRGWDRVHEKNMKKRRATKADQSKRGSTLDVIKPKGWTPADLSDLVK